MRAFHIVLAEDNPADVYLIREALRSHQVDCEMRVARDGISAIRLLSGSGTESMTPWRPDLILLDLNLPQHDGIEILRDIRARQELSGVPVVILSSSDSPRDRRATEALGAVHYIQKPSDLEAFMSLGEIFQAVLMGIHSANVHGYQPERANDPVSARSNEYRISETRDTAQEGNE